MIPAAIPLEDFAEDIVGKAIRGRGIGIRELAESSGVEAAAIDALLGGQFDPDAARAIAPELGLDAEALVVAGQNSWRPEPVALEGLAMFNTPWRDMFVNAYAVWDPAARAAALFDTGADAGAMLDSVAAHGLQVGAIYLTHTHGDHIADLDRVRAACPDAEVFVGEREPLDGATAIPHGHVSTIGPLELEARLTWGHSPGGMTYVVRGLARPLAVVGDAVFAGSMGGGIVSYADALATNREQIMTLPDETVLCPGHGPLTSVGEERRHNPFLARMNK